MIMRINMWLLLLYVSWIVLNTTMVRAFDGCEKWGFLRCGDKCGTQCNCGNQTFDDTDSTNWCCIPTNDTTSCKVTGRYGLVVNCTGGSMQKLTEPCNGRCNDWPNDAYSDFLSIGRSHKSCHSKLQCISTDKFGDGNYNCADRSDEDVYEAQQDSVFNMTALKICREGHMNEGLTCGVGGECVVYSDWCNDKVRAKVCPQINNITTNNKLLCGNATFWKTKRCRGDGSNVGVRCTGWKSGQCKYTGAPRDRVYKQCIDFSDRRQEICTNSSYFLCNKSGECIHPDLRCDLHPQCTYGEDEENCLITYKEKNLVPKFAIFKCQSPHYHEENNMNIVWSGNSASWFWSIFDDVFSIFTAFFNSETEEKGVIVNLLAVRCDKVKECHGNKDEEDCENDFSLLKIMLALVVLSMASFVLSICLHYCLKNHGDEEESIALTGQNSDTSFLDQLLKADGTKEEDMKRIQEIMELKHEQNDGFEEINNALTKVHHLEDQVLRRKCNTLFFDMEKKLHEGNKSEALVCLKRHINHDIAKAILEDTEPDSQVALIRWSKTKMGDGKQLLEKGGWMWYFLKMSTKIISLYLDFIKDIVLIVSLVGIITWDTLKDYPAEVACHVIHLLIFSVFVPLLAFGFKIAKRYPYLILGMKAHQYYEKNPMRFGTLLLLRIVTVVFAFLFPALFIYLEENAKERVKQLMRGEKSDKETMEKAAEIKQFADTVGKAILEFKKQEFAVEITIQLNVQIVMLLMNFTNTRTTSGLEAIFFDTIDSKPEGFIDGLDYEIKKSVGIKTILVLSILWSFKTSITTYNKNKSMEKGDFFPTKAKIVLGLRTFICTATRVGCIIAYFTPYLGLFNIHAHWMREQISFQPPEGVNMSSDMFYCSDNITQPYARLFRSDYRGKNSATFAIPPSYTIYTLMKLDMAYLLFWIILIFQAIGLLYSKNFLNQKFQSQTKTSKMAHVLQTLHVPDTASDWDETDGDVDAHRSQWKRTIEEVSVMIFIQFLTHIMMLMPITITGLKIWKRHQLIKLCIGVLPDEVAAYNLSKTLMWSLPALVCLSTSIDWILFYIYQSKCHPWVGIIQNEEVVVELQDEEIDVSEEIGGGEVHDEYIGGGEGHDEDIGGGEVHDEDIGGGEVHVEDIGGGEVHDEDIGGGEVHDEDIGGGEVQDEDIGGGEVHDEDISGDEVHDEEFGGGEDNLRENVEGEDNVQVKGGGEDDFLIRVHRKRETVEVELHQQNEIGGGKNSFQDIGKVEEHLLAEVLVHEELETLDVELRQQKKLEIGGGENPLQDIGNVEDHLLTEVLVHREETGKDESITVEVNDEDDSDAVCRSIINDLIDQMECMKQQ